MIGEGGQGGDATWFQRKKLIEFRIVHVQFGEWPATRKSAHNIVDFLKNGGRCRYHIGME